MKYVTGFFAFWYDFIVGDAWEVAAGVLASLFLMYLAAHYAGEHAASASAAGNSNAFMSVSPERP